MSKKGQTLKESFLKALEEYKKKILKVLKFIVIKYLTLTHII